MSIAHPRGSDQELARRWLQQQLMWEQVLAALRDARADRPVRHTPPAARHQDAAA